MVKETITDTKPTIQPFIVQTGNVTHTPIPEYFYETAEQLQFSETVVVYPYDVTELSATKQQKRKKARQAQGSNGKRSKIKVAEQELRKLYDEVNERVKKNS